MTPTEQWIFCLALVYAIPSFIGGVGITLLVVHWRDIRGALAMTQGFLASERTFERRDRDGAAPEDEADGLLRDGLRFRWSADSQRLP
jgi:hypothetical protein